MFKKVLHVKENDTRINHGLNGMKEEQQNW